MELTLICVGEENKIKGLRELVAFQHELIIFTANEEIAAEVRNCGFDSTYSCNKEQDFTSICERIKKVILLGDELPIVSFFTERIRFSFQAPITVVTKNKRYPARLYETIGAKFVVFTNCDNISFLFFE
ncbi:hypothetical protein BWGOE4_07040 [Bacillus mycoides]|uniref:Group-specific protein n=1 Tax=Bacillus mycoides TaxID=1405 RepID=A0A1D3MUY1_BACMY|nr:MULTISPECIES: hypothetical protein [Bacillus cereus group]MBJ8070954.1 hypothetical protein [Bacillus cereus]EJV55405.1 hypothetical protein IEM_05723 [Bacillus cereus BAG6O-2]MBJ8188920.1 hypothetical protein [Bacillus cereus]OFD47957.1 hypothetical protein BWGOE2_06900 [Bacillus mycoides]OFD49984.1 hypothetical protein BWGOE1_07160 [Bacillus mycoides]